MPEIGLFDAIYSARALRVLKAEMRELGSICSVPSASCALIGAPIAPGRVGGTPAPGGGPVGRPGEWIRVAKAPKAAHRGHAFL
jgi:hypothetical protein